MWAVALERSGDVAAQRCNGTSAKAPRTAFCITGAARAFTAPIVQLALHQHLIRAFGGSNGSRVFFLLKTADSAKFSEKGASVGKLRYSAHKSNATKLAAALSAWAATGIVGDAVLLQGSGSYVSSSAEPQQRTPDDGQTRPFTSSHADANAWRAYHSKYGCHAYGNASANTFDAALNATRTYIQRGNKCVRRFRSRDVWVLPASPHSLCSLRRRRVEPRCCSEERLILQHLALGWCRDAIARHETRTGRPFDVVVAARPDLFWAAPAPAWCQLDTAKVHACVGGGCDSMWVAPRANATLLLSQAETYRDCPADARNSRWRPPLDVSARSMHSACCVDSERLLYYVLRESRLPVRFGLRLPGRGYHVLRYVDGVCETILDARYDRFPYAIKKVEEGLPMATGLALRRALGHDSSANASAAALNSSPAAAAAAMAVCRDALGAQPTAVRWQRAAG